MNSLFYVRVSVPTAAVMFSALVLVPAFAAEDAPPTDSRAKMSRLWQQADRQKQDGEWEQMDATLQQIVALEKRAVRAWRFIGWNLAYNLAEERETTDERYAAVAKAVEQLVRGHAHNPKHLKLTWDIAWLVGHRIGRAGERREFRRLFTDDEELHTVLGKHVDMSKTRGPDGKPAHWLVARQWAWKAAALVETVETPDDSLPPTIVFCEPARCMMNHAASLDEDGRLEAAKETWKAAEKEWQAVGDRPWKSHTYEFTIRFSDLESDQSKLHELKETLERLAPGVREELKRQRLASLTPTERALIETPFEKLKSDDFERQTVLMSKIYVSAADVAQAAPQSGRAEAESLAKRIGKFQKREEWNRSLRSIVNYDAWLARCRVEQSEDVRSARKDILQAMRLASNEATREESKKLYEQGLLAWKRIVDKDSQITSTLLDDELLALMADYTKTYGKAPQVQFGFQRE